MNKIKLGKYKHYKGKFYEVVGVGMNTESREEVVIYKALYPTEFGPDYLWVRPLKMFLEKVEVNGEKMPRFKFVL